MLGLKCSIVRLCICKLRCNEATDPFLSEQDGYAQDETGIHYRALSAILETTPGRDCYGYIGVQMLCMQKCHAAPCQTCRAVWTKMQTALRAVGCRCLVLPDVYEDRLDFIGVDNLDSMEMHYKKQAAPALAAQGQ